MRIQAVYSFYLDFMLPRLNDSEGIKVQTTIDDCDVWISTWGASEPLFPSETDQTLSSYQVVLTPVMRPEISIRREARTKILDRISVMLEWGQESAPVEDRAVTALYLDRAVFAANALLEHIRVACMLVDIKRISRTWDPAKAEISVTVPHTESWFDVDTGKGLAVFSGTNSLGSTEGIRIGPVPATSLAQLSKTLTGGGPPPLCQSLLMNAEEALSTLSFREATLSIGSALEIRANSFAEDQTAISKTRVKAITTMANCSFAGRYYDRLPTEVCARSLRTDDAGSYALVKEAYYERNKIAHTGRFSPRLGQGGELDTARKVTEWLTSARHAVAWMDSLMPHGSPTMCSSQHD